MAQISPGSRSRSESLTSRVSSRLRQAILNAEFGLGEVLSEDKLASAFGISRTPVRDALTVLQAQGLIAIRPHHGSIVFLPTRQEVSDLYEFRAILELQALRMSIAYKRDGTIAALRKANEAMEVGRENGDLLAVAQADAAFHRAFVENCANQYLMESYDLVSVRVIAILTRISMALGNIRARAMNEHAAIISALENGNTSKAKSLLSAHIMKSLVWFDLACKEGLLTTPHRSKEFPYADLALEKSPWRQHDGEA